MKTRTLVDTGMIPGGGELKLFERDGAWSIMLGGNELMNSRLSGSEEALATLALARVETRDARVLIGGLGMGFTLRAALRGLGEAAVLVVAEVVPAVVRWARGPMAAVFAGALDDHRVTVLEEDVAAAIRGEEGGWHAILLDVDNGPDGLTRAENDWLYGAAGLAAIRRALRPGGVVAIWSAAPYARFTSRLRAAGLLAEEIDVRAMRNGRGARHVIWLAVRPQGTNVT